MPALLCVDADTFFLAVHARETQDPSLLGIAQPVVLWQYNDVVCASPAARQLGVAKHMTPEEARALVEPHGGRLVHAYWREWPGPRIWYGRYHAASRDLFRSMRSALDHVAGPSSWCLERASIDEAFIDLGAVTLDEATRLARRLLEMLDAMGLGLPLSVGVGSNRLTAKLASGRAKSCADGVFAVADADDVEALLRVTAARKLPGLGGKADALQGAGIGCIADLQRLSVAQLQDELAVTSAVAATVWERCRGVDTSVVKDMAPQSCTVTSWLAHNAFRQLALKGDIGVGGAAVVVGDGWCFEPHAERGKSNATRARWIVLVRARGRTLYGGERDRALRNSGELCAVRVRYLFARAYMRVRARARACCTGPLLRSRGEAVPPCAVLRPGTLQADGGMAGGSSHGPLASHGRAA